MQMSSSGVLAPSTNVTLALSNEFANEMVESFQCIKQVAQQILIELKSQQIVKSVRGKEGGYLLARPPAEITFGDVLRCVDGQVFDTPALGNSKCPPELRAAWQRLQKCANDTADALTFQQLLDESMAKEKMYYI